MNDTQYKKELEQAKTALTDLKTRGNDAIGDSWDDFRREIFTPKEIAESNLRVAIIGELIKARNERGISQRELEQLSGVRQPIISRMEAGATSPQLDTVLKLLAPLGKTLAVVPIETATE